MKTPIIKILLGAVAFNCLGWASLVYATDSRPILMIVGMKSEADLTGIPGAVTVLSAGNADLLRTRLAAYSNKNVRAVISFGVAGGLDPDLAPGQLVLPQSVTDGTTVWPITTQLSVELNSQLADITPALVTENDAGWNTVTATDPASRAALRKLTGAAIVDNESQVAAEFARTQNLPFAVIRVLSDPADFTLPPAALLPLKPDGTADMSAINASIAHDPGQIGALMKLNGYNNDSMATLKQVASELSLSDL